MPQDMICIFSLYFYFPVVIILLLQLFALCVLVILSFEGAVLQYPYRSSGITDSFSVMMKIT